MLEINDAGVRMLLDSSSGARLGARQSEYQPEAGPGPGPKLEPHRKKQFNLNCA